MGIGKVKAEFTSSLFTYIPVYHPGPLIRDIECELGEGILLKEAT